MTGNFTKIQSRGHAAKLTVYGYNSSQSTSSYMCFSLWVSLVYFRNLALFEVQLGMLSCNFSLPLFQVKFYTEIFFLSNSQYFLVVM